MLRKCPSCNRLISKKAASCPFCGHPFSHTTVGGIVFWLIVSLILIFIFGSVMQYKRQLDNDPLGVQTSWKLYSPN
jgi:type III secretory pathway component EscU